MVSKAAAKQLDGVVTAFVALEIAVLERTDRTVSGIPGKRSTYRASSKRIDAPRYRGLWLKANCLNREEFVVISLRIPREVAFRDDLAHHSDLISLAV